VTVAVKLAALLLAELAVAMHVVAVATHVVAVATLAEAILVAILATQVAEAAESDVAESPAVVVAAKKGAECSLVANARRAAAQPIAAQPIAAKHLLRHVVVAATKASV
jgi:hypothetical protein